MNNLTDLEICRRVSEIERISHNQFLRYTNHVFNDDCQLESADHYNPLTDNALCFQLMVKYKLSLIAPEGDQENWDCVISDTLTVNSNPNKAICLAIIEAHEND